MNNLGNNKGTMLEYFRLIGVNNSLGSTTDPIDIINKFGKDVLSCRVTLSNLYSDHQKFYLFALDGQFMFVMLDDYSKGQKELADEQPFNDDGAPLYFSETSHRVSPVYTMKKAAKRFLDLYKRDFADVSSENVFYYLLSSSEFCNKEAMLDDVDGWADPNLIVQDCYNFEESREIEPTEKYIGFGTPESFMRIIATKKKIEEEDEFDQLLMEFIESSPFDLEKVEDDTEASEDEENEDFDDDEDFKYVAEDKDGNTKDLESNALWLESEFRASKIYEPQIGDWKDYVKDTDPDFYDLTTEKPLPIVPHTILECIYNANTLLNRMVGISDMKEYINRMIGFAKYNSMLRERNIYTHEVNLHSVFTGNPGTGKTTLASILGSLLKDAGILSKGHVVMCNRASFCSGRCWGDEEKAVIQMMKVAKGGVLFIDEAYSLVSADPRDPGRQVLPNLLTYLGDEEYRDICVVLAGYPKEMQALLDTNPGIDSRFPNRFEFRDYTLDELMKISLCRMEKHGYTFTPAARHAYEEHLRCLFDNREPKTWGNARTVANLLEKIYIQHGLRVVNTNEKNLLKLKAKDIPSFKSTKKNRSRGAIGFHNY